MASGLAGKTQASSSPPREAASHSRYSLLTDPVFGSPEYRVDEHISTVRQNESPVSKGDLLHTINFQIVQAEVRETVQETPNTTEASIYQAKFIAEAPLSLGVPIGSAAESMVNTAVDFLGAVGRETPSAITDLLAKVKGPSAEQAPMQNSPTSEKKRADELKIQQIKASFDRETAMQQKAAAEIEAKEDERLGTAGMTEAQMAKAAGFGNESFRLIRTIANRIGIFIKRSADALKAKTEKPFDMVKSRINRMAGMFHLNKVTEGGALSTSGGGGIG